MMVRAATPNPTPRGGRITIGILFLIRYDDISLYIMCPNPMVEGPRQGRQESSSR